MQSRYTFGGSEAVFFSLIVAGVIARLALVRYAPPLLDIYYYDTQAVQALIHGLDPYGHLFIGIPAWLATPGAANVFAYLPGVVLFLLPFGAAADVRFGLIVADVAVALSLWGLGGKTAARASLLIFLLPTSWLFATSYPNNTLVAMCFLGISTFLESRGMRAASAVSMGLSLASSQFVWLIYPILAYRRARHGRGADVLASVAVAAAVVVPFLAWNPSAFVSNAILFQFSRPVQSLVTPMAFGFNVNPTLEGLSVTFAGVTIPLAVRAAADAAALVTAAWLSRTSRDTFFNATWFLLLSVWLLPSDFSLWYLELPLQTALIWWVMGATNPSLRAPPNA